MTISYSYGQFNMAVVLEYFRLGRAVDCCILQTVHSDQNSSCISPRLLVVWRTLPCCCVLMVNWLLSMYHSQPWSGKYNVLYVCLSHTLVHRVSSTHSHDAHLLNKLESAISAGDRGTLEDIVTTVKSSISLQKVVKVLSFCDRLIFVSRL